MITIGWSDGNHLAVLAYILSQCRKDLTQHFRQLLAPVGSTTPGTPIQIKQDLERCLARVIWFILGLPDSSS